MSNVLHGLMSALDPPVDDSALQFQFEGHLRFLCDGCFIVHVMDDSATGDIQLIALACSDTQDEELGNATLQAEGWEGLSSVEDERVHLLVLRHAAAGVLAVVSCAPRARMDNVRFDAWLQSFLSTASDAMHFATGFRADASRLHAAVG